MTENKKMNNIPKFLIIGFASLLILTSLLFISSIIVQSCWRIINFLPIYEDNYEVLSTLSIVGSILSIIFYGFFFLTSLWALLLFLISKTRIFLWLFCIIFLIIGFYLLNFVLIALEFNDYKSHSYDWEQLFIKWQIIYVIVNICRGILHFFLFRVFIISVSTSAFNVPYKFQRGFLLITILLGFGVFSFFIPYSFLIINLLFLVLAIGMLLFGVMILLTVVTSHLNLSMEYGVDPHLMKKTRKIEFFFRSFLIYQISLPIVYLLLLYIFKQDILLLFLDEFVEDALIDSDIVLYIIFDLVMTFIFIVFPSIHWLMLYIFVLRKDKSSGISYICCLMFFFGGLIFLPSLIIAISMFNNAKYRYIQLPYHSKSEPIKQQFIAPPIGQSLSTDTTKSLGFETASSSKEAALTPFLSAILQSFLISPTLNFGIIGCTQSVLAAFQDLSNYIIQTNKNFSIIIRSVWDNSAENIDGFLRTNLMRFICRTGFPNKLHYTDIINDPHIQVLVLQVPNFDLDFFKTMIDPTKKLAIFLT